jgi:hypothetical protein
MNLTGHIMRFFVETRARGQRYQQICQNLQIGGIKIDALLRRAGDTPNNRSQARHIIGMERWGIQRLTCLLSGTPPLMDEYDNYCPAAELPMPALADQFKETRATTLSLAVQLEAISDKKVAHNSMGDISVKTWLFFLNSHASVESGSIEG